MTELYQPICTRCDERGEYTLATRERWGEPYCEDCDQNANEAAYERSLSDYYGSSSPQTAKERAEVDEFDQVRR